MAGLKDILGNDFMKEQFLNAAGSGRISHAYLITGEKGMGKKTFAQALALMLLCENRKEGEDSCLSCPSCKKILAGNHPDVIYVNHEKQDSISVDEIRRQLCDTIEIRPYEGKRKIYIVPEAEKMTPQAQNALLKTLEEPPEYAVIMLLTSDVEKLLPTILSRVSRIQMKPRTDKQIRAFLAAHYDAPEESLDLCVAFARGNLGKAISLLTDETFSIWYHEAIRLCRNIRRLDAAEISQAAAKLKQLCPDLQELLSLIQLWYRDLMMYKVTKDMNGLAFGNERAAMMELASLSSYEGIEEIMEDIETCSLRLKANVNPELALELLFLNMKEK
ncbi:MAG: DNA polymerase III subunit delta' [Eubacteriales bacterium]|nr:DNA polymerase III subunit delta' [Eubacteriales bacterium]